MYELGTKVRISKRAVKQDPFILTDSQRRDFRKNPERLFVIEQVHYIGRRDPMYKMRVLTLDGRPTSSFRSSYQSWLEPVYDLERRLEEYL